MTPKQIALAEAKLYEKRRADLGVLTKDKLVRVICHLAVKADVAAPNALKKLEKHFNKRADFWNAMAATSPASVEKVLSSKAEAFRAAASDIYDRRRKKDL